MTLKQALDEYVSVYMAYRNFADRTRVEYQNDNKYLVEYLQVRGVVKVGELELGQIERYLAHLENKGFAGVTRKRKAISIRSFLTFLYSNGYIHTNLAKRIIPPFTDNRQPKFLTETECRRLRKICAGNMRDAAIVELILQTGIRLSELTRLRLEDVDLAQNSGNIRITGKGGKEERLIPLNSKVCVALNALLAERPSTTYQNFFLNRFAEPLKDRGVQKMIGVYLKKAGLGKASVHTLRHTFGIHHAVKGTSLEIIKDVMGYKDIRSVLFYQSLAKDVKNKEL